MTERSSDASVNPGRSEISLHVEFGTRHRLTRTHSRNKTQELCFRFVSSAIVSRFSKNKKLYFTISACFRRPIATSEIDLDEPHPRCANILDAHSSMEEAYDELGTISKTSK